MANREVIKFLSNPNIGSQKKKYCRFKKFGIKHIDYKDEDFLLQFINPQGKLLPRRITGNAMTAASGKMMMVGNKRKCESVKG